MRTRDARAPYHLRSPTHNASSLRSILPCLFECPGRPRRCSAPLLLRAPLPPGRGSRPHCIRDSQDLPPIAVALRRPAFGAPARARMHQHQRLCIRHHHMHPRLRSAIHRQRRQFRGQMQSRGSRYYLRCLLDHMNAPRRHRTLEEPLRRSLARFCFAHQFGAGALPISAERTAPCRSIARSYFCACSSRRNSRMARQVEAAIGRRAHPRALAMCTTSTSGIVAVRGEALSHSIKAPNAARSPTHMALRQLRPQRRHRGHRVKNIPHRAQPDHQHAQSFSLRIISADNS